MKTILGLLLALFPIVHAQLTIQSVWPPCNATHVPRDTSLQITFSSAVVESSVTPRSFMVYGALSGHRIGTCEFRDSAKTVVFSPSQPFLAGEQVFVTLGRGLRTAAFDSLDHYRSWTFTVAAAQANGRLAATPTVPVGEYPYFVTAGDVDGNGRADIITANMNGASLTIFRGDGSGTLSSPDTVVTEVKPSLVVPLDMDGDGDVDLALGHNDLYSLKLVRNNGNSTFAAATSTAIAERYPVATQHDFDGDGDIDLATGSYFSDNISILRNDGTGVFTVTSTPPGGPDVGTLVAGDFDNDGDIDIVVGACNVGLVKLFLNDGSGAYTLALPSINTDYPASLDAADMDRDGDLDLVVTGTTLNFVRVFKNDGTGTFVGQPTIPVGNYPLFVKPADLTGDGYPDLVVINYLSESVTVLRNLAGNSFDTLTTLVPGHEPRYAATVDLNDDGALDLVVSNRASNTVSVFLNQLDSPAVSELRVDSTWPGLNAQSVERSATIGVRCSQAVAAASVNDSSMVVFGEYSGRMQGSFSFTDSNQVVRFDPTEDFFPGERVCVTVTRGVRSSSGGSLSSAWTWRFVVRTPVASGEFGRSTDVTVGTRPYYMAMGDLDGNKRLDMAVGNLSSATLSLIYQNASGELAAPVSVQTDTLPSLIVPMDVDGDADLDLVVGHNNSFRLTVLSNAGASSFSIDSTVSIAEPWPVAAIGDYDGDGDLDLATGSYFSNNVTIVKNSGQGKLAVASTPPGGPDVGSLVSADVDADGDLDIVVADYNIGVVKILLNDGSGEFSVSAQTISLEYPSSVDAADFNNDGKVDIAVTSYTLNTVRVYTNSGTGSFSHTGGATVGTNPWFVRAADLTGDGMMDLVVVNYASQAVSIVNNNGVSGFAASTPITVGLEPRYATVGDLNGDGRLDIAVTNRSSNTVSVLLNGVPTIQTWLTLQSISPLPNSTDISRTTKVTATFSEAISETTVTHKSFMVYGSLTGHAEGSYSVVESTKTIVFTPAHSFLSGEQVSVTIGRNMRSDSDHVLQASRSWGFTVSSSRATGILTESDTLAVGAFPHYMTSADIDGDGRADIIAANMYGSSLSIFKGNGTRYLAPPITLTTDANPSLVVPVDIDADGDMDLALSHNDLYMLKFIRNDGTGVFGSPTSTPIADRYAVATSQDLDGDGDVDLVTGSNFRDSISILKNDGTGGFTVTSTLPGGPDVQTLAAGDLDGDGDIDLASGAYNIGVVKIFFNEGAGSFSLPPVNISMPYPAALSMADLDRDGDLDLVVTGTTSDVVKVFKNDGAGAFTGETPIPVGSYPLFVKPADLTGDGYPDLVVINYLSETVTILKNRGGDGFDSLTTLIPGHQPRYAATVDLDDDGALDLVVSNRTSNSLSVFLNQGSTGVIRVQPSALLFPSTRPGEHAVMHFSIRRTGSADTLHVDSLSTNMAVFQVTPFTTSIAPESSAVFQVTFAPESTLSYSDTLRIFAHDSVSRILTLRLSGKGNFPPHAARLNNVVISRTGRLVTTPVRFSSWGSVDTAGAITSTQWYVKSTLVGTDTALVYDFGPGTSTVRLLVSDAEGSRDSSVATVTRTLFRSSLGLPVTAGLTMGSEEYLFGATDTDTLLRIDTSGAVLSRIPLDGAARAPAAFAYNNFLYVATMDSAIIPFAWDGTPFGPGFRMPTQMSATPTVDSATSRMYISLAANMLLASELATGVTAWSYTTIAPIASTPVISRDRTLVFSTFNGLVYGIDLTNLGIPVAAPWIIGVGDSVRNAPAIDNAGNAYFITKNGKLLKIGFLRGLAPAVHWQVQLEGPFTGSPVIGGDGTIYVGSGNKKLYSVRATDGSVLWALETTGAISCTPAISNRGVIYFGNDAGEFFAVDASMAIRWRYAGNSVFRGTVVYQNGAVYAGTVDSSLLAFYDGAPGSGLPPMWGTYLGSNRRAGVHPGSIVTSAGMAADEIPTQFSLTANFPNPFNPSTNFILKVPSRTHVLLQVFDLRGREVATLLDSPQEPGTVRIRWNASAFPSGMYFFQVIAGQFRSSGKMLLLK